MDGGEDLLLSGAWAGVNRSTAPYALSPTQSPDCADCALSGDKDGVLGARLGRYRLTAWPYNILGVVPANFPYGRFRIIADSNGTWTGSAVPWPAIGAASAQGYDRVLFSQVVTQSASGTTNGATLAIPSALTLANYSTLLFNGSNGYSGMDVTTTGTVAGEVNIQGYIDSVWTTLYRTSVTSENQQTQINLVPNGTTGSLSSLRISVTVSSGSGSITASAVDMGVWLIYGELFSGQVAS